MLREEGAGTIPVPEAKNSAEHFPVCGELARAAYDFGGGMEDLRQQFYIVRR